MDFKTDILLNIPHFLEQLDSRDEELNLHAFKSDQFKKKPVGNFRRFDNKNKLFCRICQMSKKSRNIFTNHTFGDIEGTWNLTESGDQPNVDLFFLHLKATAGPLAGQ